MLNAEYINSDKNLINLDLMVLSETKLTKNIKTQIIGSKLFNWSILKRYDAEDGRKHMGLILLSRGTMYEKIKDITYHTENRDNSLQIQGIRISTDRGLSLGFVYCRSCPKTLKLMP